MPEQLHPAKATHMSGAETAEPSCMVETRESVETAETARPGEAVKAAAATAETGEAAEGIAVAVIRPVIVIRPARGIVAAGRETVITRGNGVTSVGLRPPCVTHPATLSYPD